MDGWTDERRKEGKTSRQHGSQKGSALALRTFLVTCEQGALHFHFSLGSANYVTGPTLGKDLCKFHCMKWMESLFSVFLRVKQLSVNWQRRQWHPTPVLLPGKARGRRSLVGCSSWGREELDMTERLHFYFSLSCIGEGNGNPLQCSCLENPRDGGAWWAAVYGVAQSRTRLKWLSSSSSYWGGVGQLWILWLKLPTGQGLKLVPLYPDFIAEEHLFFILLQAVSYCRPSPVHLQNPWEACGQPSLRVHSFSPAETRYNTAPSIPLSLQNPERIGCGCSLGGSDGGSGVPGRVV